jgi:hypothetical protein
VNTYHLTFDPSPTELASRQTGGACVLLLWSRCSGRAAVLVDDETTGEIFELDVRAQDNPLELFVHPFAYLAARGRAVGASARPDVALPAAA